MPIREMDCSDPKGGLAFHRIPYCLGKHMGRGNGRFKQVTFTLLVRKYQVINTLAAYLKCGNKLVASYSKIHRMVNTCHCSY